MTESQLKFKNSEIKFLMENVRPGDVMSFQNFLRGIDK